MTEPTQADLDRAAQVLTGPVDYPVVQRAIAQALADQREEIASLLRTCAAGRTEYAGGYSLRETNPALRAQRAALESEAQALESAARIVEGNHYTVLSLLPSWRWTDEMREHAHD